MPEERVREGHDKDKAIKSLLTGLLSPSQAVMASCLDAVWAAWIPAIESKICMCILCNNIMLYPSNQISIKIILNVNSNNF